MKKALKKAESHIYHYKNDMRIGGAPEDIYGDMSGIRGDMSKIYGDMREIYGNVSDISGDVSDISGDVSGISGNVDECDITDEERKNGVYIKDLIG